jgi:hypothetical protein
MENSMAEFKSLYICEISCKRYVRLIRITGQMMIWFERSGGM